MRPLPTASDAEPTVPATLELGPSLVSPNTRRISCATQRCYPWLLLTSTLIAGAFCYLYLTKPVLPLRGPDAPPAAAAPAAPKTSPAATEASPPTAAPGLEMPDVVAPQDLATEVDGPFEETNL